MRLALFATLCSAMVTPFLRGRRGLMVLVGLLSPLMLTRHVHAGGGDLLGHPWLWWPVIGGVIAPTSLSIIWFAIRFFDGSSSAATPGPTRLRAGAPGVGDLGREMSRPQPARLSCRVCRTISRIRYPDYCSEAAALWASARLR
jgi:hypothetical protein